MLNKEARVNKLVLRDQTLEMRKADNVKGGLVVIAIIAILIGQLVPAVQKEGMPRPPKKP